MTLQASIKWATLGLAALLLCVLAGVVGYTLGNDPSANLSTNGRSGTSSPATPASVASQDFGILDEIYLTLEENYVDSISINPGLIELGAINGVISALGDPHTVYIDPESYALGTDIISGTFQGIGAQVEQDPATRNIIIVTPFSDSPAEVAGILPGDIILAVDGESTEGWSTTQAVQRIRGPEGEPVILRVQHRNGDIEDLTVIRATIIIPTVFVQDVIDSNGNLQSNIAYLELQQFTEQTVSDLSQELQRIGELGYDSLIVDLRHNPGGALSATVDVSDMFLEEGIILTQIERSGQARTFEASPGGEAVEIPLVLLIGPGSASGSEVLAGALRDNNRATLIGEDTFGKGSVNQLFELSDGGAIYVTTARWLTPSGEQVEGVGLSPDQEVTFSDADLEERRDVQLFAAIDFLLDNPLQSQP